METIVKGNLDKLKEYKYFKCNRCGWIGKASKNEYVYCGNQQDGDAWSVKCPYCKYTVYDIQNERLLSLVIQAENSPFQEVKYGNN